MKIPELKFPQSEADKVVFSAGFDCAMIYWECIGGVKLAEDNCNRNTELIYEHISVIKGIERAEYLYDAKTKETIPKIKEELKKNLGWHVGDVLTSTRCLEKTVNAIKSKFPDLKNSEGKSIYELFDERLSEFNYAHSKLCQSLVYDLGYGLEKEKNENIVTC